MPRAYKVILWTLSILLGFLYLTVGLHRLTGQEMLVRQFADWGYPGWFVHVVGAMETVGAVGLLIPRFRIRAVQLLLVVMTGAMFTHLVHAEWSHVGIVLGYAAVLGAIWFLAIKTSSGVSEDARA